MNNNSLPSRWQLGDQVSLNFGVLCGQVKNCRVIRVHFIPSKVSYDLEVEMQDNTTTRIYNVDSAFLQAQENQDVHPIFSKILSSHGLK